MKTWLINFFMDEEGLTMVEYAIAGGIVTIGTVTAFSTLGDTVGKSITGLAKLVEG